MPPESGAVALNRRDREVALLLFEGVDPKLIAAHLEVAVSTVYGRIAAICARAGVGGAPQLVIWLLQHPQSMLPGGVSERGLHPRSCECGAPYCVARLAARMLPC